MLDQGAPHLVARPDRVRDEAIIAEVHPGLEGHHPLLRIVSTRTQVGLQATEKASVPASPALVLLLPAKTAQAEVATTIAPPLAGDLPGPHRALTASVADLRARRVITGQPEADLLRRAADHRILGLEGEAVGARPPGHEVGAVGGVDIEARSEAHPPVPNADLPKLDPEALRVDAHLVAGTGEFEAPEDHRPRPVEPDLDPLPIYLGRLAILCAEGHRCRPLREAQVARSDPTHMGAGGAGVGHAAHAEAGLAPPSESLVIAVQIVQPAPQAMDPMGRTGPDEVESLPDASPTVAHTRAYREKSPTRCRYDTLGQSLLIRRNSRTRGTKWLARAGFPVLRRATANSRSGSAQEMMLMKP